MKKTIAALLALLMVFSLTACGADKEAGTDDPNRIVIGDYQALYKGYEIMEDSDGDNAIVVTYDFTNNSKEPIAFFWSIFYTFTQNGQELKMSSIFINDNYDAITDSGYEEVAPGDTLEVKSAYKLRNLTDEVVIRFYNFAETVEDSLTIPLSDAVQSQTSGALKPLDGTEPTEPAKNLTAFQEYWNGDWYGWWLVTNASGDEFDGWDNGSYWWDCCARIEIDGNGDGAMIVWDEDGSADDMMAGLEIQVSDAGYAQGRMKSVSGYFWDCEMGNADWLVEPEPTVYDHLIIIEGTYTDPEDFFSYFDYEIFLRPWGMDWADVAGEEPDYLPGYYESWYLPAIEAGIAMPDVIGGGNFLAPGEVPDNKMEPQSTGSEGAAAVETREVTGDVVTAGIPTGWSLVSGTQMNGANGSDYICHAEEFQLGDAYLQTTKDDRDLEAVRSVLESEDPFGEYYGARVLSNGTWYLAENAAVAQLGDKVLLVRGYACDFDSQEVLDILGSLRWAN